MKLEETENLKLQYVNRIETNTTHINNIQESDTDLIEKITEILMMTLTPQLRKIAIKKRASHPTSIREPDLDFRK